MPSGTSANQALSACRCCRLATNGYRRPGCPRRSRRRALGGRAPTAGNGAQQAAWWLSCRVELQQLVAILPAHRRAKCAERVAVAKAGPSADKRCVVRGFGSAVAHQREALPHEGHTEVVHLVRVIRGSIFQLPNVGCHFSLMVLSARSAAQV